MSAGKLRPGDLVSIEPWDCEGVEPPWGWEQDAFHPTTASRQVGRAYRIKLAPGTMGVVVAHDHPGVDDGDYHYVIVVGPRKLGIPFRFLHKVET